MNIQVDVLIIGGGFAGVTCAKQLEKRHIHTLLVDKKEYFEVTFANLRNVVAPEKTQNHARKLYRDILTSQFEQSAVETLEANTATLANGTEVYFKYAIIASGSSYPSLSLAKSLHCQSLLSRNQELANWHQQLQKSKNITIIGGGLVGVELAGEIAHYMPHINLTLAHSGQNLLNGFKRKTQKIAKRQLENLNVNIQLNTRYCKLNDSYINPQTKQPLKTDLILETTGTTANNHFLKMSLAHILNDDGLVMVDEYLRVQKCSNLFALGDIADVGEAKLGYLASQQGKYLANNLCNIIKGKKITPYKRHPLMALIPIGPLSGITQLPFMVTTLKVLIGLKQKDLFVSKIYKSFK